MNFLFVSIADLFIFCKLLQIFLAGFKNIVFFFQRKTTLIIIFRTYILMVEANSKLLFVFDFDHTFVDANSDTFIYQALSEKDLPTPLKDSYREGFWTEFMQRVFLYFKEQGKSPNEIKDVLIKIPIMKGFIDLMSWIKSNGHESIILSDANTLFIDWILGAHNLRQSFSQIFTNWAEITPENSITIRPYHSHECPVCPMNMCKKAILKEFIGEKRDSLRINYIGDGGNDFCPVTILEEKDQVFARKGYSLEKKLQKRKGEILAQIHIWETGEEILKILKEKL